MGNKDIQRYSFYRLLYKDEKEIVIPQIQREYAQGRVDNDVEDIRNSILGKIENAIFNDKKLDFDFIYGVQQEGNRFVPLDGQQRLTTLFLVHWYIFKRCGYDITPLLKFKYESRQASVDFCRAIINNDIKFAESKLAERIKDETWFYYSWCSDATVNGMLTMIQAIHTRFTKYWNDKSRPNEIIENFIELNPITFKWLEIDSHGMTDDLYIKMNSRGKPLTRFENFKVRIEKHLPTNKEFEDYWKNLIDNDWTDLLWKYRKAFSEIKSKVAEPDYTIDDEFMQFFIGMLLYRLAIEEGDTEEIQYFANNLEFPLSIFEEKKDGKYIYFIEKDLEDISLVLDWFSRNDDEFNNEIINNVDLRLNDKFLLELFVSDSISYVQRVKFFCIVHFVKQFDNKDSFEKEDLRKWMWKMRNLIENTVIDSPQTFVSAIRAVNKMGNNCLKFEDYLLGDQNIDFFGTQAKEERVKLKLDWKDRELNDEDRLKETLTVSDNLNLILAVENNPLYRGCISFLLPNDEKESIEDFILNVKCASILLDENRTYRKEYILARTLLALTPSEYSENTVLLDKDDNIRNILKKEAFKEAFAKLFDELRSVDHEKYLENMQGIIDGYNDKSIPWKYYIIKNSELLNKSDSKKIALYGGKYMLYNTVNATDSVFVLDHIRNMIVSKLLEKFKKVEFTHEVLGTGDLIFYRGYHLWLKLPIENYYLTIQFSLNDVLFGFDKNQKEIVSIQNHNFGKTEYWLLYKKIDSYPDENDIDNWISKLTTEIDDVKSYALPKSIAEFA